MRHDGGMAVDVRRYRSGDAAACCVVIEAAEATMAGLNAVARDVIKSKSTPAALDAYLRSWRTLVATLHGRVVGLGALDGAEIKRRGYEVVAADRLESGEAVFESTRMRRRL